MMNPQHERDDGLGHTLGAVALVGSALTLLSPFAMAGSKMTGVAIGSGLAVANLWVVAFIVRGFLRGAGVPFGVAGALKFATLLFVVWIVLRNGWADPLALVLGYAALPLGVVIGQLGRAAASQKKA